ncbi:unnamed protein product [Owenia fusiformis]|uniref:Uncharacterized protein n=1 Tax=Owenia fusiformis TaxID=6347 RepID=A0A8J1UQV6_OWEFU|nr:unnamed protein product [Owenia fusiformis]
MTLSGPRGLSKLLVGVILVTLGLIVGLYSPYHLNDQPIKNIDTVRRIQRLNDQPIENVDTVLRAKLPNEQPIEKPSTDVQMESDQSKSSSVNLTTDVRMKSDQSNPSPVTCESRLGKRDCLNSKSCGFCINNDTSSCATGTKDGAKYNQCKTWCYKSGNGKCRLYKKLIVFGNGPSLKGFDFLKTRGVDTLGMNLAFRYWKQIDWWPTYYASFDKIVNVDHIPELTEMVENADERGMKLFFTRENIGKREPKLGSNPKIKFIETIKHDKEHQNMVTLTRKISTGSLSARLGQYLGYEKILLLGIDMNYVEHVNGSTSRKGGGLIMEETPKENPNYFFANYQRKGDVYNIPKNEAVHITAFNEILEDVKNHPEFNVEYFNGSPVSRLNKMGYKYKTFEDFMKL